jgi:hypothetical protein
LLLALGCGPGDEGETGITAPGETTGIDVTGADADDSGGSSDGGDATTGDGDATGDGDGSTGDGDASTGDGTTGDGDGGTGDGDGGTGDGDGSSGDGDGSTGDGDGTSGDGDGSAGDGDGTSGDGDGSTGDGDGDGCAPAGTTGGDGTCVQCDLSLASTASSVLSPLNGNTFLGEAILFGEIIYALDEVGPGRVIYTADTNILYDEITTCPLWEWLGGTPTLPVVAGFGKHVCSGLGNNLGNYPNYTHWGTEMPAQYVGDPCALKADFDVVIFCAFDSLTPAMAQTLIDFVEIYGGGVYLASEYYPWADDDDVAAINSIANGWDVDFGKMQLDWGSATGDINFTCFPMPQ